MSILRGAASDRSNVIPLSETAARKFRYLKQDGKMNTNTNHLFPVFLKLEKLNLLLIGGGYVAREKLDALLTNSPQAKIKLVAGTISEEVKKIVLQNQIPFEERDFEPRDLKGADLAIIAINDKTVSRSIHVCCRERGILTNVADTPEYCDFYLSSVVQKGNLKIAISTNGKSPTIAKRVKEVLNNAFPDEMEDLLSNMQKIRNSLQGDFSDKVRQLNDITRVLSSDKKEKNIPGVKTRYLLLFVVFAIFFMSLGYLLLPLLLE